MEARTKKYLQDILSYITEIEGFVKEKGRSFDVFFNDLMYRRAIERDIEVIGEIVTQITNTDQGISLTNDRSIKATRNRVAHDYNHILKEILWGIVINDLPELKTEVMEKLNE